MWSLVHWLPKSSFPVVRGGGMGFGWEGGGRCFGWEGP